MVCKVLKVDVEVEEEDDTRWLPLRQRVTLAAVYLLFTLHGIPVRIPRPQWWRLGLGAARLFGLAFVNCYVAYRVYKLAAHRDLTADTFPLINAAVSACIADSVLIHAPHFTGFSARLFGLLHPLHVPLGCVVRLAAFYALFLGYVLACSGLFPFSANHWFDAGECDAPDFLHAPAVRPFAHVLIFATCGGCVVSHLMLFCLVCCLLQEALLRVRAGLLDPAAVTLGSLKRSQALFVAAADLVQRADALFSLFGFVGLGSVFARACSCIHFYLNMKSPFLDTWSFLILQVSFDILALTAVSCFAAGVPETARLIPAAVFRVSALHTPRCERLHAACLAFVKVVVSADVHLSAWRLFPFTRRVVPTVIGLTLSYVAVIVQMHHAACTFERPFRNTTNGTTEA